MGRQSKWTREIHIDVIIVIGLALAGGWLCATFLFAKVDPQEVPNVVSELLLEFCKTVFAAAVVAFVLDRYLRGILYPSKSDRLPQAGITAVYPSRLAARNDMVQCVQAASRVDIMGISLRDLLHTSGQWASVWEAIVARLEQEHKNRIRAEKRLRVRLLVLDPRSSEGRFRSAAEEITGQSTALYNDVPLGLGEVERVRRSVHADDRNDPLQVRIYHHCPFSLIGRTNKDTFVEQYYYKDHRQHVDLPLLRYGKPEQQKELGTSFEIVWESASPGVLDDSEVGTAGAIENAAIQNIFRWDERDQCGLRQINTLKNVDPGQEVRILTISGKFYVQGNMRLAISEACRRGVTVRVILLNPVSSEAVLRAIADSHAPEEISDQLSGWAWEQHRFTHLYNDIERAVEELRGMGDRGCAIEVRLHHSSVACALLLTPASAFVEQYIYGRSRAFQEGRVLGHEYPVIEYGRQPGSAIGKDTPEQQMLSGTFDVIWNSYSVPIEQYRKTDPKQQLEVSLADLARWTALQRAPSNSQDAG